MNIFNTEAFQSLQKATEQLSAIEFVFNRTKKFNFRQAIEVGNLQHRLTNFCIDLLIEEYTNNIDRLKVLHALKTHFSDEGLEMWALNDRQHEITSSIARLSVIKDNIMYHTDNEKFNAWMKKVDIAVAALIGVEVADLMDQLYYDRFESGMSPNEAAKWAIEDEMNDMGIDSSFLF